MPPTVDTARPTGGVAVNRRYLAIGLLDGFKITAFPKGRVRVEPQGG